MISRTIGLFGVLASIMALSSLVYGAFQEPLYPYMQGVIGGALDVYRTMRELVFSSCGWALSKLINICRQYFSWLPPAPWFKLPGIIADLLLGYLVGYAAAFRAYLRPEHRIYKNLGRVRRGWYRIAYFATIARHSLMWPKLVFSSIKLNGKEETALREWNDRENLRLHEGEIRERIESMQKLHRDARRAFGGVICGTLIFFLLAYAENRIGL